MTTAYESGREPPILVQHRLRIAREYAGLEQEELAKRIGVSRTTIGNAENGRVKARKITLNAWSLACGVPVSWIETGAVASKNPPDDDDGSRLGESNPRPIHYE
jgi:transcriptional regulator with XRE-family HTH domain